MTIEQMQEIEHYPIDDLLMIVNTSYAHAARETIKARFKSVEADIDTIREAWETLRDWDVIPARITPDERGHECWQAYNVIEAILWGPR